MTRATTLLLPILLAVLATAACSSNRTFVTQAPPGEVPLTCWPNLDGKITADELAPQIGVPVTYQVATGNVSVDLKGQVNSDGKRVWDVGDLPGATEATFEALPLDKQWYAADFPGGQFVVKADASGSIDLVFAQDQQALWLLGSASADANPPTGKVLLPYDQPVALYRFPLAPGASWTSVGTVTGGMLNGLPYTGTDTYQGKVAAAGELDFPDWIFQQVMRVSIDLTITPSAGAPLTRRTDSLFFECFGELVRAQSHDGETDPDFTTAAEVRRLIVRR